MNLLERAHILIVDDDPLAIHALAQVLVGAGRLVFERDGAAALARVEASQPDLVLLDHEMPGLGGLETCRELKRRHPDLSVVFITSRDDTATEVRALDSGAADFVTKPLVPELVLARVQTQLRLKDYADRIRALACTDPLTGLANRRSLDESLAMECARARRRGPALAVLMIDIDHFKAYNDSLGHPAGDAALVQVSHAIQACLKRSGDVAARFGGEEFCVVLPETDAEQAGHVARQISAAVRALGLPHPASSVGQHVSVSIGVAASDRVTGDGVSWSASGVADLPSSASGWMDWSPADWIARADAALYQAKRRGRNQIAIG
ncbi:MAG: diguanylate cyclase [Leptothrix sp. (in: b-proteobacteria)]